MGSFPKHPTKIDSLQGCQPQVECRLNRLHQNQELEDSWSSLIILKGSAFRFFEFSKYSADFTGSSSLFATFAAATKSTGARPMRNKGNSNLAENCKLGFIILCLDNEERRTMQKAITTCTVFVYFLDHIGERFSKNHSINTIIAKALKIRIFTHKDIIHFTCEFNQLLSFFIY